IYSVSKGKNDYTDDYKCRGMWVNYLAGGSKGLSDEKGLNIPIDMSFALHSDAGTTYGDTIIGTLGIFQTAAYNGTFANGTSRYASRDLTDLVQSSIVNDIRTLYEPNWTRRGLWNKSYYEAWVPRVPAMLLEILSHENFADMRYGLDPRFRFTVSRAIYKGILRFLSSEYKTNYVVEPLPVTQAEIHFTDNNEISLSWQPVEDPLEPTARADKYIVYTRIGDHDFDNGTVINKNHFNTTIPIGQICSYKITAINKGGESFPSEILSAGRSVNDKGTVLVINGFDRVCAPADFAANADTLAGFLDDLDHGVPYKEDISYIGKMKEFRRQIPWTDDDAAGFGDSYGNYEKMVIAGNSFDYPALHGAAILKAGYSFASCSAIAVENGTASMNSYSYVDLILGKQKQTKMGRGGVTPLQFKTFSKNMEQKLTTYCQQQKSNLFISGAYVATDLWDNHLIKSNKTDRDFATNTLKYKWRTGQAAIMGEIKSVASPYPFIGNYMYYNKPNPKSYVVESPDAIEPADNSAVTIFRYSENNLSAGVAYKGNYKTCILGFPFESIRTEGEREQLMKSVLDFFNAN
ncbi:MAG: xanthan lyase, partial [Bacteroidaceae bacterium]|nr:xanthan lyase [Bacteroidaceae bacterium]